MKKAQPFGRYLLLDRIAVGGMAEVYGAKTFGVEGFERLVAIKRILPTMVEDDEFVAMFIDEARIAARLSHSTIAQILELGRHEETYFIAMEYVAGRDVRLIIDKFRKRDEKMPVHLAAYIMAKMGEGLDYAHSKTDENGNPLNIIHRDISPQNVLVSYEGGVKIIDFGIAKAAGRNQKTQVGILKGKFAYMSPEQVRGSEIDHRSDIFSAGVMFYEMLTGSKLFTGESDFSTLEKVRVGAVRAPSELNPAIPPELEAVVMKALAKDREERYQNGGELHDDLMRYLYREGEVFSTRSLAQFMRATFVEEVTREMERQHRWWSTQAEETVEFDLTKSGQPARSRSRRTGSGAPPPPPSENTNVGADLGNQATAIGRASKPSDPSGVRPAPPDEAGIGEQATRVGKTEAPLDGATAIIQTQDLEQSATKVLSAASVSSPPPVAEPIVARPGTPGKTSPRSVPAVVPPPPPPPVQNSGTRNAAIALVILLILAASGYISFIVFRPKPAVFIDIQTADGRSVPNVGASMDGVPLLGLPPYMVRPESGRHELSVTAPNFKPVSTAFIAPTDHHVNVQLEEIPPPTPPPTVAAAATGSTGASGASGGTGETAKPVRDRDRDRDRESNKHTPETAGGSSGVASVPGGSGAPDQGEKVKPVVAKTGPGSISLNTTPAGAMFKINGKGNPTQRTPIVIPDLAGDSQVTVTFMKSGYQRKEITLIVRPGETTPVSIDLEPVADESVVVPLPQGQGGGSTDDEKPAPSGNVGIIKVLCIPVSTVIIDGTSTGKRTTTHAIDVEVSLGNHSVSCLSDSGKQSPPLECNVTAGTPCEYRKKVQ